MFIHWQWGISQSSELVGQDVDRILGRVLACRTAQEAGHDVDVVELVVCGPPGHQGRLASEGWSLEEGIVKTGALQAEAFRGFTIHIVLETIPNQPRGSGPLDQPVFGEKRGPYCGRLPDAPFNQDNPVTHQPNFADGVDEPTGKGSSRAATGWSKGAGYPGSPAESALMNGLLGPVIGTDVDDVPDLGALLLGPMARGATVTVGGGQ